MLHAAVTLHGPGSCGHPKADSHSPFGAINRLIVRQICSVSNTTAHTTPNAHEQEWGNLNFTCMRGARREGRAVSDLSGCHKWLTRLKASLRQKKLVGAPLRGDGRTCRAAGSRRKVQLHLSSGAPHRICCQRRLCWQSRHRLPGELPRHTGAEAKEQVTEETSKPKIISGQMSTELTHQQVGKETFSKPYQRRHLNPLQTETTAHLPKQSLNLEPGQPPGSGHAVSTHIGERWK